MLAFEQLSKELQACWGEEATYIDDLLNLAEDSSNGLANDGNSLEQASLADEDVEKGLVDTNELVVC
jgi:hypothetical protein